jgi:DNA replication protein DnaC
MDDLESLIAKTMEATQKLQAQRARSHTPVESGELARKDLTVEDAVNKIRCIPERFRAVVRAMLSDGVPPAIAELTPALDQTGVSVPFLALVGKSGAGKTSTALAITVARYMLAYDHTWTAVKDIVHAGASTAEATNKVIDQRLFSWRFMHADDLCTCRRASKLGDDPRELVSALNWNPLIIDDVIGQKDPDGDLYRVLRHREEQGYQTIITSGLTPPAIEAAYGAQFSRRMFSGVTKIIEKK